MGGNYNEKNTGTNRNRMAGCASRMGKIKMNPPPMECWFYSKAAGNKREVAMRIIFITLLVTVLCSLTVMSYADDKSDCLINCSNEKRSKDMYCPPAGGYTDEDHKQCIDKNAVAYNGCTKDCSPSPAVSEPSPVQPVESGATDSK